MDEDQSPRRAALSELRAAIGEVEEADAEVRRLAEARGQTVEWIPLIVHEGDQELVAAVRRWARAMDRMKAAGDRLAELPFD
jgi:hypothetical protein